MEYLVINLKENLISRRKRELSKIQNFNNQNNRDLLLISSGKVFELDLLINSLNELIDYFEKSKKTQE